MDTRIHTLTWSAFNTSPAHNTDRQYLISVINSMPATLEKRKSVKQIVPALLLALREACEDEAIRKMLSRCIHQRGEAPVHMRVWERIRADYIKSLIRGCCLRASCTRQQGDHLYVAFETQKAWWKRNRKVLIHRFIFCLSLVAKCSTRISMNSGSSAVILFTFLSD